MGTSQHPSVLGIGPVADRIDAGTLCRAASPCPGVIGAPVRTGSVIIASADAQKALDAAWRAIPKLPAAVRQQVADLLTLRSMAMIGAATAIWGGSHLVGVGFGVDVVLLGVGVIGLGAEAIRAGGEFVAFWKGATTARDAAGLDRAADHFACAITIVGVNTALALFARTAGRVAVMERTLARWTAYIAELDLKVGNKGVLWSKIGADMAEQLARRDGKYSLEMLLKKTEFFTEYRNQFGGAKDDATRAMTQQIWELLSRKFAAGLEGQITAYVNDVELFKHITGPQYNKGLPQITAELEEIAAAMGSNPRITSVVLKDVNGNTSAVMMRDAVLKSASLTH